MADASWRAHERVWQADPGNQDALQHAIAARRRAGLAVPGRMLARQVHGPRTFGSRLALTVFALDPDGRPRGVGRTPGEVAVPEHRALWVQPAPPSDAGLLALAEDAELAASLEGLSLAPDVTDAGLEALPRFGALTRLDLSGCIRVTARGLARAARAPGLEVLDLWAVPGVDAAALAALAPLRRLVALNLRRCARLGPGALAPLAGLAELTTLAVGECPRLDGDALAPLAGLTHLVALDLGGTAVDDAGVAHLLGLQELTLLNLSRTRVGPAGVARLAALPSLAQLYVVGCGEEVARAAVALARGRGRPEVIGA